MATCKYTFTGADGKSITVKGIPALKEFLIEGGLAQYLPARATALAEAGGEIAFSAKQDESKITNPVDPKATPQEKVKTLVQLTRENKPIIKKLMAEIDAAIGTKSSDSVKAPEKILQKASRPSILAKKPWHNVEHIRDSYRFKTVIDSVTQLPDVTRMLEKAGIEIIKRDTEKVLSPGEWGWRIAAFDLRMPNGQLVEYYLPVKELEKAKKEKGHYLFEQGRNLKPNEDVEKVQGLMQESRDLYQGVWDAYLSRTGESSTAIRAALTKASASAGEAISKPSADKSRTLVEGLGETQLPSADRTAEKAPSKTKAAPESSESIQATNIETSDLLTNTPIIAESIGINVNQDGTNQYADKIVDGKKTLETRASDSLRPYVGKRVAIVRTGDGPAKAIGAVTIGEPIKVTTQKQFDQYRDQTLVPKDSKFDIAPGGVKYLYPVENPVRYATELDVGLGIVARKVIAPSLSRREQKNAAASRVSNVSSDRFKRTDELQQAVTDLQEGKITQDEYNAMVDNLRPVYPYEKVPALTTPADAKYALANGRGQSPEKAAKYGLPSDTLSKGDFAQLRLDIPSYQEHDSWVVSIHTPKSTNREVQAAYDAGAVIGYESVAAMTDVTFGMNQKAAIKIAQGTSKGTIATMLGKWKPISNQAAKVRADAAIKDSAWTQVGMDPFRHSYFYDRDTMRPVLSADEVIQIGPLVLAKNATFSEDGTDITGAPIAFSGKQRKLSEDAKQQQVFLQQKAEEAGYKTIDEFGDKDFDAFVLAASQWRQENPADMMFSNRQSDGWILSRDETGRFRFGAGAKAYRLVADVANNVLDRIGMKPVSPELSRALRKMKTEVEKAQNLTVDVAKNLKDLPEQERQMISDVIEGELKRGVKPPKRVLELAASMQSIMSEQTQELVRLGMLTPEAAGRWDGKYLPRFYESKIGDETKAWMKAAKSLMGRTRTMQGITGNSLKARGMFENVPVADVQDWLDEGWEVRDPTFDPLTSDVVTMWRDYTRNERDDMGEIRDAMFRFVMGYNKSQRDMALGRLYENLATSYASRVEKPGYVKVPATTIEDTANVRRYGKLGGKWVPKEVMDQLSTFDTSMQNDLLKMYLKGLSMWKEGKTVLNPVSHANNVLSNLTMAHFAGVSYWDAGKYGGAVRDLIKGDPMVDEAKEAGLFGGTFNRSELMDQLPEQLKAMAQMTESKAGMAVDRVFNALSFFLRKPAGKAYEAEDLFFRYLIYRDARKRGVDVDDAVDWSQNFIFTYDDLPKGARLARDFALPFFSYTYKVVPVLARTALEHPMRYAAPAAALYTVNALMYAMAASLGGGEDEDWWTVIRRYATDPEFRDKARKMEEQERENLPPWMKGASATLATPKAIRLGMDDVTNLPVFLDVSRIFPGGDLLDANANAGGIPLLQPITPSNPVLNTVGAMIWNKDPFFGKDIVDKNDTSAEAAAKRGKWLWQQFAPAVAIGNYHWDRALNVIANVTGQDILGYTGTGKDGLPVQPGFAAMQTMGIKARPIDLELSEQINKSQQEKLIRDLEAEIRQIKRLEGKGAITEKNADAQIELQQLKKDRLKEGLTVEGEKRK